MTRFLLFESLRGVPGNEGLKGYELKDSFMGGEEAERVAGMVKSQLSDYAKKRLQARLEEMGLDGLEEVAPLFAPDSPSGNARSEEADPLHWMRFVKMGVRAEVELADGSLATGTILSGAAAREFIEEHDVKRKDKRAYLVVRRTDDDYDIVPWAEMVDVRRGEG